ncbi:hypothetical protein BUALT_Bualt13G0050100 [Buddleja alternifolia]|uniref:Uncharacterized protein n=1 Tax=Buddleja alternifolia TaxID=168488 RepID=A0AAV6WK29_9LAMI|nr:hypothetical protein BUALT_Bualt13G0050100 [Buddleja alternifolia]
MEAPQNSSPGNDSLVFEINKERFEGPEIDPSTTLLEFLRTRTRFRAPKLGCGEGVCAHCAHFVCIFKNSILLHKEKTLDHLTNVMSMPENKDTAQSFRDMDAYKKWLDQDKSARFAMLSCMHDNLICEFEKYSTAKELWEVLQVMYGSTSATRLRALTLKSNQYVLDPKHSMIHHLNVMKDIIRDLQNAGSELTDEQLVLAVLRSLLD